MEFKVGDLVEILDGSNIRNYAKGWVSSMKEFVGQTGEITSISKGNGDYYVRLKHNIYSFDIRGIKKVETPLAVVNIYENRVELIPNEMGSLNMKKIESIEDGFRNYINHLKEKEKNKIKLGDTVRISDSGNIFSTYSNWLLDNKVAPTSLLKWHHGRVPNQNKSTYTVTHIAPHRVQLGDLYLVENSSEAFIIGAKGLTKID